MRETQLTNIQIYFCMSFVFSKLFPNQGPKSVKQPLKLKRKGANSYGQLGLGYKCEQILTPEVVKIDGPQDFPDIISIAGGAGHSLLLDAEGSIYSSGWNHKGQLGKDSESTTFTKLDPLCDHGIREISSGWDFNAAICKNNDVFVWGSNHFNQIGLKGMKSTPTPTLLTDIKGRSISCGLRHMAIVTVDGKVFICGSFNRQTLPLIQIPDLDDVISVAAGQFHTIALKKDGTASSWGVNKFGQLGHPENEQLSLPKGINFDFKIKSVHAGWTHSALLTADGVFTFGRNTYGQLGRESSGNDWKPKRVDVGRCRELNLGSEHNLAVTEEGDLFCWGWNEHGNCGNGSVEDVKVPEQILKGEEVALVACGTGQSFAVVK